MEGKGLEKRDIIIILLGLFAFAVAGYRFVVFTGRLNRLMSVFITLIGIFLILMVYRNVKRRTGISWKKTKIVPLLIGFIMIFGVFLVTEASKANIELPINLFLKEAGQDLIIGDDENLYTITGTETWDNVTVLGSGKLVVSGTLNATNIFLESGSIFETVDGNVTLANSDMGGDVGFSGSCDYFNITNNSTIILAGTWAGGSYTVYPNPPPTDYHQGGDATLNITASKKIVINNSTVNVAGGDGTDSGIGNPIGGWCDVSGFVVAGGNATVNLQTIQNADIYILFSFIDARGGDGGDAADGESGYYAGGGTGGGYSIGGDVSDHVGAGGNANVTIISDNNLTIIGSNITTVGGHGGNAGDGGDGFCTGWYYYHGGGGGGGGYSSGSGGNGCENMQGENGHSGGNVINYVGVGGGSIITLFSNNLTIVDSNLTLLGGHGGNAGDGGYADCGGGGGGAGGYVGSGGGGGGHGGGDGGTGGNVNDSVGCGGNSRMIISGDSIIFFNSDITIISGHGGNAGQGGSTQGTDYSGWTGGGGGGGYGGGGGAGHGNPDTWVVGGNGGDSVVGGFIGSGGIATMVLAPYSCVKIIDSSVVAMGGGGGNGGSGGYGGTTHFGGGGGYGGGGGGGTGDVDGDGGSCTVLGKVCDGGNASISISDVKSSISANSVFNVIYGAGGIAPDSPGGGSSGGEGEGRITSSGIINLTIPISVSLLLSPTNNTVTNATPMFTWLALHNSTTNGGITNYTIQIDNNTDFSSPNITNTTTGTNYTIVSPLPDGIYYWRVKANYSSPLGSSAGWSDTWLFRVGHHPPVADNLTILPLNPFTTDNLTVNYSYYDQDGDNESGSEIRWYKNSELQSDYSNMMIVPYFATSKGETWCFTVRPKDGIDFGNLVSSSNVTILNSLPSITIVAILPEPAYTNSTLVAIPSGWYDADNDTENYVYLWQRWNGTEWENLLGETDAALSSENFVKGDKIRIICTPYDLEDAGISLNDTIIISNALPIIGTYSPEIDQTITEEESQMFNITASDPDTYDVLTISWYLNDTLVCIATSYTFVANYTSAGWYEVKVIVSDGELSVEHTWILTVTNVNRAPVIDSYSPENNTPTVYESDTMTFQVTAHDPDGDTLTMSSYIWYVNGEYGGGGNITLFIGGYDTAGIYNTTVVVSDGELTTSHTWILTVKNVNREPVLNISLPVRAFDEDHSLTAFNLNDYFSDPDEEILNYTVSGNNHIVVVINANGTVDLQASADWYGNETITFRATDPYNAWVEDTIVVTVNPVNDAPVIAGLSDQPIIEDATFWYDITPYISDIDNDILALVVTTNSSYITVHNSNHTLEMTYPNGVTVGYVRITVSDGVLSDYEDVVFMITPVNDAPVIYGVPEQFGVEDVAWTLDVTPYIDDIDNITEDLMITVNSSYVTVDSKILTFLYPNGIITDSVKITVSDGIATANQTITVTITPVNDAPTISGVPAQYATEDIDLYLNISSYISDVDNSTDELTININSTYAIIDGFIITFNYPNGILSENVRITVSDGINTSYQDIMIIVTVVNDAPVINSFTPMGDVIIDEGEEQVFTISASDVDNTDLTITWYLDNNLIATGSTYTYTADYTSAGTYTVKAVVSDGSLTDEKTWTLTVNNVKKQEKPALIPGYEAASLISMVGVIVLLLRRRKN